MTSMFNTSDFIYIHTYVWLSGWTHRAGISDSISVPAPCSLLSLVTVPGKLGLVERGNTLQSAVWGGSLLSAPWLCFPGKAGGAAGRHKGDAVETILPRRGHHGTDGATAANLPMFRALHAVPRQPSLPAARAVLPADGRGSPKLSRHSGPAVPTPTHGTAAPEPLARTDRALVEQIASKCLARRHREGGKPRFVPGSAHNTKKAAAPLKNTTACKLSN